MKKLIVLSVIFALVAGSVFAADVGVEVFGKATLLQGSNEEKFDSYNDDGKPIYTTKDYNTTDYGIGRIRVSASGATEDGTVGGSLRYDAGGSAAGWVWWKPSDLFKLQIGSNGGDGEFGLEGVTGWGYYMLACETIINNGNTWGGGALWIGGGVGNFIFRNAFYGGWNAPGIILTVTPVEALTVNIGLPLGTDDAAYKEYKKFTAQITYNIDGVGLAGVTYENSLFEHESGAFGGTNNDNPYVRVYFGLTSIENLGIDFGIGYKFSDSFYKNSITETGGKKGGDEITYTYNNPLAVGVGVNFSSGALGVKARILGEFMGSSVVDKTAYKDDKKDDDESYSHTLSTGWGMLIDVQPSFAVNETMTAYLSTGIGFWTGEESTDPEAEEWKAKAETRSLFAWHVQPYVAITPSYWNGTFFAGFRLESPNGYFYNGEKGDVRNRVLNWSIPIGITMSF
jgi:opacity protein-like surface antigen